MDRSGDDLRAILRSAHIFSSTVRRVLDEKCLREATSRDINIPQVHLLKVLSTNGIFQLHHLALFLGVSHAAASKSVDKLVRHGLLSRSIPQDDRRAVNLAITRRGRRLVQKYEDVKSNRVQRALCELSPDQVSALSDALEAMSFHLLQNEGECGEICLKCGGYYEERCVFRALHGTCGLQNGREVHV